MKRKYVDLKVNLEKIYQEGSFYKFVKLTGLMNFEIIGITKNNGIPKEVLEIWKNTQIKLIKTIEIEVSEKEVVRKISRYKSQEMIISLAPKTLKECRKASSLTYTGTIILPMQPHPIIFDQTSARLAKEKNHPIEVQISNLMKLNKKDLQKTLRTLRLEIKIASKYGIPLIATSNSQSIYDFYDPKVRVSILTVLLETGVEKAVNAISNYPKSLIEAMKIK